MGKVTARGVQVIDGLRAENRSQVQPTTDDSQKAAGGNGSRLLGSIPVRLFGQSRLYFSSHYG